MIIYCSQSVASGMKSFVHHRATNGRLWGLEGAYCNGLLRAYAIDTGCENNLRVYYGMVFGSKKFSSYFMMIYCRKLKCTYCDWCRENFVRLLYDPVLINHEKSLYL